MDNHRKEINRKSQEAYRERQKEQGKTPVYVTAKQKELLPKLVTIFEENQELRARNQDLEAKIKELGEEIQELKKPWWKKLLNRKKQ